VKQHKPLTINERQRKRSSKFFQTN